MEKQDIQNLRENYKRARLSFSDLHPNPKTQFEHWFKEAKNSQILEPNAMILSTVSKKNTPNARVVLLKEISNNGLIFYTNYKSHKGLEIEDNPNVCLTFLWKELERQVRVTGLAKRISEEHSKAYFQSRPRGSQIGAWVSPQSDVIPDRSILENKKKEIETRFEGQEKLPLPPNWGGYEIQVSSIEFWQGRPNRLHDRFLYTKTIGDWKIERLAP